MSGLSASAGGQTRVSDEAHSALMTTARRPVMANSTTSTPWITTPTELASILSEMRPVIDRFADRDRRLMTEATKAA